MENKNIGLYVLLLVILGLLAYNMWGGSKDSKLNDAIKKLTEASQRIDSAKTNLDKVLINTDTVLKRNADFKTYISDVEGLIKNMDREGKKRERLYLNNLDALDKSIENLKQNLFKMNSKLPELQNEALSTKPN
jgi:chromosome segregation ATPase